MNLQSYPSLYHSKHRETHVLRTKHIFIQEKIDGSQFSFGKIDGTLICKSKNKELDIANPPNLFTVAIKTVIGLIDQLIEGMIYRSEVISRPRHNVLTYDRTPKGNIVLFDISDIHDVYAHSNYVAQIADQFGLEVAPILYTGAYNQIPLNLLDKISMLGGQKIEGYVIKQIQDGNTPLHYGADKKLIMEKVVSDSFKEIHKANHKLNKSSQSDYIINLANQYRTPARYHKAIQHLREDGTLTESVQDIGSLIKEIIADVEKEHISEIKDELYNYFKRDIHKTLISGFPEFYKILLTRKVNI